MLRRWGWIALALATFCGCTLWVLDRPSHLGAVSPPSPAGQGLAAGARSRPGPHEASQDRGGPSGAGREVPAPPVRVARSASDFDHPLLLPEGVEYLYVFRLPAGSCRRLVADQRNELDIELRIERPDGKSIRIDSSLRNRGKEEALLYSPHGGTFRVIVSRASRHDSAAGRFLLHAGTLRPARETDRLEARAEEELSAARDDPAASRDTRIRHLEIALACWRRCGNLRRQGDALTLIAELQAQQDRPQQARSSFRAALEVYDRDPSQEAFMSEALVLNEIGAQDLALCDQDRRFCSPAVLGEAKAYFEASLPILSGLGFEAVAAADSIDLGRVSYQLRDLGESLQHLQQGLALAERVKAPRWSLLAEIELGEVYQHLGGLQAAADHLQRARKELPDGDPALEPVVATQLGNVFLDARSPWRAIPLLRRGLELRQQAGDDAGVAKTLLSLSAAHYSSRRFNEADNLLARALTIFRRLPDREREGEAAAWTNRGWVSEELGNLARAADCFRQGLAMSRDGEEQKRGALCGLAMIELRRGHPEAACRYLEQALGRVESERATIPDREFRMSYFAQQSEVFDDVIHSYMQEYEAGIRPDGARLALALSERERYRVLLDGLADQVQPPAADSSTRARYALLLAEAERDLQLGNDRQAAIRARRAWRLLATELQSAPTPPEREGLPESDVRRASLAAGSPSQGLEGGRAESSASQPLSVEEIQKTLDDDTLLLAYHLGKAASYLWLVSASSVEAHVLPGEAEIKKEIEVLAENLPLRGRWREALRAAEALSHQLLAPVRDRLGHRRLLISAHGPLQQIQLGALPDPAVDPSQAEVHGGWPEPLVKSHEVVDVLSASAAFRLGQREQRRPPPSLYLAMVAPEDEVSPRPAVEARQGASLHRNPEGEAAAVPRNPSGFVREASGLRMLLKEKLGLDLSGYRATHQMVTSGLLRDFRIIVFITHGTPEGTLALAGSKSANPGRESYLFAEEVPALGLRADLVVLSACDTGLGQMIPGEGVVGLSEAFLRGGATRTLVSFWNVEDAPTAELMIRFQGSLNAGLSPAAALRAAQISMWRDVNKDWSSPASWAGWAVQGAWK